MNIKNTPIMNFYHLTINPDERDNFLKAGKENMLTSIQQEDGVYFMSSASEGKDSNYIFEIYKDEESYQNHINSKQFKDYQAIAKDAVDDTDSFNLTPQFIGTNYQDLCVDKDNNYVVNMAKITLVDSDLEKFGKIVKKEMNESMEREAGVVAMLAGNMFDIENEWRFFEIYQDEAAYEAHTRTRHFIDYMSETKEMVYDKTILSLHGDTIVDRSNMNYES